MNTIPDEEAELRRYYAAPSEESARETLDRLLRTVARPVVERVVRRLDAGDREDAAADAMLRIAQILQNGRRGEAPVLNLSAYAARTAERACDESLRRRFRVRYNVTKRVQTHLRKNEEFYAWQDLGALRAWPPPPPVPVRSASLNPESILHEHPSPESPPRTDHLIRAALLWSAGALPVETLVTFVQAARDEFDRPDAELREDLAVGPKDDEEASGEYLARVWEAIETLRPNQARALLLNLRLGDNLEDAFERFGLEGVAAVLGIDPTEFTQTVLPTLPWSDRRIAELLDCTESQVSGLRSSARRALAHRLEVRSAPVSHPRGKAR